MQMVSVGLGVEDEPRDLELIRVALLDLRLSVIFEAHLVTTQKRKLQGGHHEMHGPTRFFALAPQ